VATTTQIPKPAIGWSGQHTPDSEDAQSPPVGCERHTLEDTQKELLRQSANDL